LLRRASIIGPLGTRDQADVELLTIAIESAKTTIRGITGLRSSP